jgi:hypothetical protein
MATYYVNSAAGGANTGLSKTDAYTSLVAAHTGLTLATGDEVWIAHTHTETASGAVTEALSGSGTNRGIRYRSMNFTGDVPTFGAAIVCGTNAVTLHGVVEDIHFDNSGVANDLTIAPGGFTEYVGCKFSKQAAQFFVLAGGTSGNGIIRDSEFACGTSYTGGLATGSSPNEWELHRNTFTGTKGTGPSLLKQASSGNSMRMLVQGSDLSGWDNAVDHAAGSAHGSLRLTLAGCEIPASWEIEDGNTSALLRRGAIVTLVHCTSGTLTAPAFQRAYYYHMGSAVMQSTRYRNSGAQDGTTKFSWEITALSGRTWDRSRHAVVVPIPVGWVAAGTAITVTAYVAHNAVGAGASGALTNAECALRIYGPSNAGSPKATQYSASTMAARNASATDLTTDSASSWTGSSIGTKQKMALTYTPTIAGPVYAELVFCPGQASDKTIYADAVATLA